MHAYGSSHALSCIHTRVYTTHTHRRWLPSTAAGRPAWPPTSGKRARSFTSARRHVHSHTHTLHPISFITTKRTKLTQSPLPHTRAQGDPRVLFADGTAWRFHPLALHPAAAPTPAPAATAAGASTTTAAGAKADEDEDDDDASAAAVAARIDAEYAKHRLRGTGPYQDEEDRAAAVACFRQGMRVRILDTRACLPVWLCIRLLDTRVRGVCRAPSM